MISQKKNLLFSRTLFCTLFCRIRETVFYDSGLNLFHPFVNYPGLLAMVQNVKIAQIRCYFPVKVAYVFERCNELDHRMLQSTGACEKFEQIIIYIGDKLFKSFMWRNALSVIAVQQDSFALPCPFRIVCHMPHNTVLLPTV